MSDPFAYIPGRIKELERMLIMCELQNKGAKARLVRGTIQQLKRAKQERKVAV